MRIFVILIQILTLVDGNVFAKGCFLSTCTVYRICKIFRACFSPKRLGPDITARNPVGAVWPFEFQPTTTAAVLLCFLWPSKWFVCIECLLLCVVSPLFSGSLFSHRQLKIRVTHSPCHAALPTETRRWQREPRYRLAVSYRGHFSTPSPVFPPSFICVSMRPLTLVLAKSNYPPWKNNTIINTGAVE